MKGRRWTVEEDQYLRERVLQSISNGGSQLDAFDEVGKKIGRTSGACGFRWNAVLRQQDPESYSEAKKKRVYTQLQRKRRPKWESLSRVGEVLEQIDKQYQRKKEEIERLKKELAKREGEIIRFERPSQNVEMVEPKSEIQQALKDRYQDLLVLMEKLQSQPLFAELFATFTKKDETNGKTKSDTST